MISMETKLNYLCKTFIPYCRKGSLAVRHVIITDQMLSIEDRSDIAFTLKTAIDKSDNFSVGNEIFEVDKIKIIKKDGTSGKL